MYAVIATRSMSDKESMEEHCKPCSNDLVPLYQNRIYSQVSTKTWYLVLMGYFGNFHRHTQGFRNGF